MSGLLRSLLYQLLLQWQDPILQISPPRWRSYDLELAHFPTWTNRDLLIATRTLLRDAAQSSRVCIFIDENIQSREKRKEAEKPILMQLYIGEEDGGLAHVHS